MKKFSLTTAINQLELGKKTTCNKITNENSIPFFAKSTDIINIFLPRLTIIGDSREQDNWIEKACKYYGINYVKAKKDKKLKTENLKEGDYSFIVDFDNTEYNYIGKVSYERKGSPSELYNNCIKGRKRVKREFDRFQTKQYEKVVLLIEFGEKLTDLINVEFSYWNSFGRKETKTTGKTVYSTIMSWKQPNNNDFDIIQSNSHNNLFWYMIQDMFYYFRQDIRLECLSKNLIKGELFEV